MPITCKFTSQILSQDEFHAVDKTIMKHAFDIQNEFGRLCDEQIYKNELAFRCDTDGITTLKEAVICVEHENFHKLYFLDMLASNSGIYELKATEALHTNNDRQLINYLLLAGLHHGKLINFGPASVEHRFISTSLTPDDRKKFSIDTRRWDGSDMESSLLAETLCCLLKDWGVFLSVDLYTEALTHFLGGHQKAIRTVEISADGRVLGKQKITLLRQDTGLHVSAIWQNLPSYEKHLGKFFFHTGLKKLQWLNFNKNTVQMITIKK
jgi:GxxExxY protein